MELIKGILLGFAVYTISSVLAKYTMINQWLYIIWFSSLVLAYSTTKNIRNKAERKPVLIAIAKVSGISTIVAVLIGYLGSNIDKWL